MVEARPHHKGDGTKQREARSRTRRRNRLTLLIHLTFAKTLNHRFIIIFFTLHMHRIQLTLLTFRELAW